MVSHSPAWYRARRYLHFDVPIGLRKAETIVSNPEAVSRHSFYPLIVYEITSFKVKKDKITNRIERVEKKRPIAYASHIDSHIYSYYAEKLSELYEVALKEAGIGDSVLAFRSLGKSNIEFAGEAFKEISRRDECGVVALDVKGFFDNLDHDVLKCSWAKMLKSRVLPKDHFSVFKSITKYSSVRRDEIFGLFGISENNPKAGRVRICEAVEFRNRVRVGGCIKRNSHNFGIPQGSSISALLSNIYMFDFDVAACEMVKKYGGRYFRYCDDMLFVVPKSMRNSVAGEVRGRIRSLKLDINTKKTEICAFTKIAVGHECDKPLQYLGFVFDGRKILLRSAALARFSERMKAGVKLAKSTARKHNSLRVDHGRDKKELFKRKLYERYSHLGRRNFIRYGYRAAEILDSNSIKRQLKPLWDRLQDEIRK
ncbi:hypothetical protein G3580_00850 [Nitrogeniibacter mangrovi]|uniref:Reverse transcriptase domain-containing protein n=1 Tax=Nitrogeniibacter mangrovi TaxID=2016596 RepID=A0A6C1B0F5_9RHOO|nr:antiviral reverse transcriptase Drt2 [Nitrogeniibacter mangrovi]QID16298.1 hypothetical protein G3580_00850 [Nitrogeniibacter mangrovi]